MPSDTKPPAPTFPVEVAVRHICAQHRSLARVLKLLEAHGAGVAEGRVEPDFDLLESALRYVGGFCERLHHPAEEAFLFAAMRRRGAPDSLIEPAELAHETSALKFDGLLNALEEWRCRPGAENSVFLTHVAEFTRFQYDHMNYEESVVLPSALDILLASDWIVIADAFRGHQDPLLASGEDDLAPLRRQLAL